MPDLDLTGSCTERHFMQSPNLDLSKSPCWVTQWMHDNFRRYGEYALVIQTFQECLEDLLCNGEV